MAEDEDMVSGDGVEGVEVKEGCIKEEVEEDLERIGVEGIEWVWNECSEREQCEDKKPWVGGMSRGKVNDSEEWRFAEERSSEDKGVSSKSGI